MGDVREGVRLALDWGEARIGVAACDPAGVLAYPLETVGAGPKALDRVAELVAEHRPIEVILGMPVSLAGRHGPAAAAMLVRARELASRLGEVPIRLVDERLSTKEASRRLSDAGRTGRRKRAVIDQAAAVAILRDALEAERRTRLAPGRGLEEV